MVIFSDNEKESIKKILTQLTKDYVRDYYIKIIGQDWDKKEPNKEEMIFKLLSVDWPEELKHELYELYARVKKYSKPQGGYIVRISYDESSFDIDKFISQLKSAGFKNITKDGNKIKFVYEDVGCDIKIDEDEGRIYPVTYPIYLHYEIDFDNNILIIRNLMMNLYEKAKKIFAENVPGIKLGSVIDKFANPTEINNKFKRFIEDLKTIVFVNRIIRECLDDNGNSTRGRNLTDYPECKNCLDRLKNEPTLFQKYHPLMIYSESPYRNKFNTVNDIENLKVCPLAEIMSLVIQKVYLDVSNLDTDAIPPNETITVNGKQILLRDFLKNSGFDDFKEIELTGENDIFGNNIVKICTDPNAGGRIGGIQGIITYEGDTYEFVIKHGIRKPGMNAVRPDSLKVKFKSNSLIYDKEKYERLLKVRDMIQTIYNEVFL
jgi:hypothetical protein